jgi:hypothetical protein
MPLSEIKTSVEPTGGTKVSYAFRRRGQRGRGGRGTQARRPDRATPAQPAEAPPEILEPKLPVKEPVGQLRPETERPRPPHPIRNAIDEVNQIIESLKTALGEMEEVLELLEMAGVQKELDEGEIAALQQALRRLQRPEERERGPGHQPPRQPR